MNWELFQNALNLAGLVFSGVFMAHYALNGKILSCLFWVLICVGDAYVILNFFANIIKP